MFDFQRAHLHSDLTFWNDADPSADFQLSINSPGNLSLLNSPTVRPYNRYPTSSFPDLVHNRNLHQETSCPLTYDKLIQLVFTDLLVILYLPFISKELNKSCTFLLDLISLISFWKFSLSLSPCNKHLHHNEQINYVHY